MSVGSWFLCKPFEHPKKLVRSGRTVTDPRPHHTTIPIDHNQCRNRSDSEEVAYGPVLVRHHAEGVLVLVGKTLNQIRVVANVDCENLHRTILELMVQSFDESALRSNAKITLRRPEEQCHCLVVPEFRQSDLDVLPDRSPKTQAVRSQPAVAPGDRQTHPMGATSHSGPRIESARSMTRGECSQSRAAARLRSR